MSKEEIKTELVELVKNDNAPMWMNWMSYAMLKDSYLLPNQTPRERYQLIADAAAGRLPDSFDKKQWSEKFFNLFWKGWLTASTPVMANLGTDRGLPVSCSASYVGDSLYEISFTNHEIEMLSKYGFGTAAFLDVRGGYEPIATGGTTNPVSDWVKKYWNSQQTVTQGSVRRGSTALYLDFWHKDLLDILPMLETTDKLHLGVVCDDSVRDALSKNDKNALDRYLAILQWRARKGKPYIIFIDNARRQDPQSYKDLGLSSKHSNLCVVPETKILTSKGHLPIGDLEGKEVEVWNGKEFTKTIVRKTGESQKIIKVVTKYGQIVECTPYHKFYIQEGHTYKLGKRVPKVVEKRAHELKTGDKLIKYDLPVIEGEEELELAYENGFYTGDGTKANESSQRVYLYKNKKALLDHFKDFKSKRETETRIELTYSNLKSKYFVPDSKYSIDSRLKWLAGLFDSDGCLLTEKTSRCQSIQLASTNGSFLKDLQLMLQTLGVNSKIILAREDTVQPLPKNDGSGKYKDYLCQKIERILISSHGLQSLLNLGLKCNRLNILPSKANRCAQKFNQVLEVIDEGRVSDTFCFTESNRNMGMFNGLLTGNCTEIFLHTDSEHTLSCVLSSMNGSKFDEWKDTDAVFEATVFLDCIAEDLIQRGRNIKGLERVVRFTEKSRALGLGLLGFHTYLQDRLISIDSFQARMVNAQMFQHIQKEAIRASKWLASEMGEPEWCKGSGMRNTHLLAIAPNTSSAFMAGAVSQGIEPFVANVFRQKLSKVGAVERINPSLLKLLRQKGVFTEDIIDSISFNNGSVQHLDESILSAEEKEVFKTGFEINQKVLIDLAEQRQQFICQGQSLNLFFSDKEEESWIHEVHKYAFNQVRLKSLYYVRTQAGITADKDDTCKACES